MNTIGNWWGSLGVQPKLQIPTQLLLMAILLLAQQWVTQQVENIVLTSAEERASAVADGAINGLNTMMVTKVGSDDLISDSTKRKLFIQKMGASDGVKELRIVRGKGIVAEFDAGLPEEQPVDELDRKVLETGKSEYKMLTDNNGAQSLRAVMPFIAKKEFRTTNCLKCHGVDEGTVLGLASVVIDIKDDVATIQKMKKCLWAGYLFISLALFAVIFSIGRRTIIGPLRNLRDAIVAIDVGKDFTRRVPSSGNDEIAQTAQSFNRMVEEVQKTCKGVHGSVVHLRNAAANVATASKKVVAGSAEQSNSSTAMAATIEEMTVSISVVASSADDALKMTRSSNEVSDLGRKIIDETIDGMEQISMAVHDASKSIEDLGMQSRQITSVVQVIKEVADQTNLLALNAAIEAARAGEQGRGFAVVADEVRKLAERTSNSTMEIATMVSNIHNRTQEAVRDIQEVVGKVSEGQSLARQAGQKIVEIQEQSAKVASSFSEITAAIDEESTASNEMARNVENIAHMAEVNHAAAESMVHDVEQLNDVAKQVADAVSIFKV
jgi:methyl-accepting chemotaxis protein